MDNTTTLWIIVGAAAVAAVIIGALLARHHARIRHAQLEERFGPEYDRAVEDFGSVQRADRELSARAKRVESFKARELSTNERARFNAEWLKIQAQFVDDPAVAVSSADDLINQVLRASGYPVESFEQRVADLSVEHPAMVQHYRAAHALAVPARAGQVNTEELRQAVVHYRFLFADLLRAPEPLRRLRESHA